MLGHGGVLALAKDNIMRLQKTGIPYSINLNGLKGSHRVVVDKPEYVLVLERIAKDGVAPITSKMSRDIFKVQSIKQLHDMGLLFAATDRKLGQSLIGINPMLQEAGLVCNLVIKKPNPEGIKKANNGRGKLRPRFVFHVL